MAASATDKFKKGADNFSTTLSAPIVGAADSSASLTSVSTLPTDTGTVLVVDRVDASGNKTPTKREYIKGVISGSAITALVRGLGGSTAQAHSSGAVVESVSDSDTWNDAVDGVLVAHNQDGTHKSGAVYPLPTISDYTNATHTHTTTAQGGQITDAALSAAVGIAKGGTGATTATAGFNALSPVTTKGDIIARDTTNNIRLPVGADNQVLTADSTQASGVKWAAAPGSGQMTLLKSNSATHSTNAVTNVDTFAISGLTGLDTLFILVEASVVTAAVSGSSIYNSTDGIVVSWIYQGGASIPAGNDYTGVMYLRQNRTVNTKINSWNTDGISLTSGTSFIGASSLNGTANVTTAWTGAWTIALRLGATTGTVPWSWAIYKIAGQ